MYVVLSRVTTRNGLVLCEKLDLHRSYDVNEKLLEWERRIQQDLEVKLFQKRGQYNEYLAELQSIEDE